MALSAGWNNNLTDWLVDVKAESNKEIRRLAVAAYRRVKLKTPVDTGTLQDGWVLNQAIEQGVLSVVLYNDVEYVLFVEYGTIYMAGYHMLEQTMNELAEGKL